MSWWIHSCNMSLEEDKKVFKKLENLVHKSVEEGLLRPHPSMD